MHILAKIVWWFIIIFFGYWTFILGTLYFFNIHDQHKKETQQIEWSRLHPYNPQADLDRIARNEKIREEAAPYRKKFCNWKTLEFRRNDPWCLYPHWGEDPNGGQ